LERVAEELMCPICLEPAQLPVNFVCFRGCGGRFSAGSTCLRAVLCTHCANEALQLHRPPGERFQSTNGLASCLICRSTRVDARLLSPDSAYLSNHNVMAVMDALGMGGTCRHCPGLSFPSQTALLHHYLRSCPAALVPCRFRGCAAWHPRATAAAHEATCPVGRCPCSQCGCWVDRSELLRHLVSACRQRVVRCVLCSHAAPLPDMLQHLRQHQRQLLLSSSQGQAEARQGEEAVAAAAREDGAGGGRGGRRQETVGPKPPEVPGMSMAAVTITLSGPAVLEQLQASQQQQHHQEGAAPQRELQRRAGTASQQQQLAVAPGQQLSMDAPEEAQQEHGPMRAGQAPQERQQLRQQQQQHRGQGEGQHQHQHGEEQEQQLQLPSQPQRQRQHQSQDVPLREALQHPWQLGLQAQQPPSQPHQTQPPHAQPTLPTEQPGAAAVQLPSRQQQQLPHEQRHGATQQQQQLQQQQQPQRQQPVEYDSEQLRQVRLLLEGLLRRGQQQLLRAQESGGRAQVLGQDAIQQPQQLPPHPGGGREALQVVQRQQHDTAVASPHQQPSLQTRSPQQQQQQQQRPQAVQDQVQSQPEPQPHTQRPPQQPQQRPRGDIWSLLAAAAAVHPRSHALQPPLRCSPRTSSGSLCRATSGSGRQQQQQQPAAASTSTAGPADAAVGLSVPASTSASGPVTAPASRLAAGATASRAAVGEGGEVVVLGGGGGRQGGSVVASSGTEAAAAGAAAAVHEGDNDSTGTSISSSNNSRSLGGEGRRGGVSSVAAAASSSAPLPVSVATAPASVLPLGSTNPRAPAGSVSAGITAAGSGGVGSSGSGGLTGRLSADVPHVVLPPELQCAAASAPGGLHASAGVSGGAGSGGVDVLLQLARRRGVVWPPDLDGSAAAAIAAAAVLTARDPPLAAAAAVSTAAAVATGPEAEAGSSDAGLVRAAAAILRASAEAAERRWQRRLMATAGTVALGGRQGAACLRHSQDRPLGRPERSNSAGSALGAAAGSATSAAAITSGTVIRAAAPSMEAPAATHGSGATAHNLPSEVLPLTAAMAAAGNAVGAPLPPPAVSAAFYRRSFSDTELVFDVVEQLMRASAAAVERASASG
ncbi:hypothetical protein Agub_g16080, partial [Astrephomene gubernaculifera]